MTQNLKLVMSLATGSCAPRPLQESAAVTEGGGADVMRRYHRRDCRGGVSVLLAAGPAGTGRTKTYFVKNQEKSQQPLIIAHSSCCAQFTKANENLFNFIGKQENTKKNHCLTQMHVYNACRLSH